MGSLKAALIFLIMDYNIDPYSAINNAAQIINSTAQYMGSKAFTREMWEEQKNWNAYQTAVQQNYNSQERRAAQEYATSERQSMEAYNREEWQRNVDYNSPAAQMKRLVAAGINPNSAVSMVSMNGSSSLPTTAMSSSGASSSPLGGSPSLMDIAHPFGSLADAALVGAQIKKLNSESAANEINNRYLDEFNQLSNEEKRSAIAYSCSSKEYQDSLKGKTDKEIAWMDKLNELAIDEGYANIDSLLQGIDKAIEETNLFIEKQKTERKTQSNIDASTALMSEQAETERAKQENIDANTENIDEDTRTKSLINAREIFDNSLKSIGLNPQSSSAAEQIARALGQSDNPESSLKILRDASSTLRCSQKGVANEESIRYRSRRYGRSRPDPIWNR